MMARITAAAVLIVLAVGFGWLLIANSRAALHVLGMAVSFALPAGIFSQRGQRGKPSDPPNERAVDAPYGQLFERNLAVQLLVDPGDGAIIDANPAAAEFYGYTRDQLRAMRVMDLNTLSKEQVLAELARAQQQQVNHFNYKHRLRIRRNP